MPTTYSKTLSCLSSVSLLFGLNVSLPPHALMYHKTYNTAPNLTYNLNCLLYLTFHCCIGTDHLTLLRFVI